MKKFVYTLILLVACLSVNGQEAETAKPLTDTEIVRKVALIDIEGDLYYDVVVTLKSISPDYLISDKYKVKVKIEDSNGKKIWKRTLKNDFLYIFSNGQVQVGKNNFVQILIYKSSLTGDFIGTTREKEGVY